MEKRLLYRDTVEGLHASPGAAPEEVTNPDTLSLSDAAMAEIRRQAAIQDPKPLAIRIGLRGGGCSGYTYTFDWDHEAPRDKDIILNVEDDTVKVYVDFRSMKLLKGTTLDYHRSLMSQGFKFHNPNSSGTCGCGESTSF